MNRQTKRLMQRQQKQAAERPAARRPPVAAKKERIGPRQFLREVRQELKKVNWPTRRELFTYTLVVLFTVVIVASFVFGVDFLVGRGVLYVFGRSG